MSEPSAEETLLMTSNMKGDFLKINKHFSCRMFHPFGITEFPVCNVKFSNWVRFPELLIMTATEMETFVLEFYTVGSLSELYPSWEIPSWATENFILGYMSPYHGSFFHNHLHQLVDHYDDKLNSPTPFQEIQFIKSLERLVEMSTGGKTNLDVWGIDAYGDVPVKAIQDTRTRKGCEKLVVKSTSMLLKAMTNEWNDDYLTTQATIYRKPNDINHQLLVKTIMSIKENPESLSRVVGEYMAKHLLNEEQIRMEKEH
jgi:hypothetical protein